MNRMIYYQVYEERGWNSHSSFDDQYHHHQSLSSSEMLPHKMLGKPYFYSEPSDNHLHHDSRRIHRDDNHLHVNKTTTLLKKKKDHDQRANWGSSNPILRPPLGSVAPPPSHQLGLQYHQTTAYHGGRGDAYEYDGFIGGSYQPPSSDGGHTEGYKTRKENYDGYHDLEEKSHELESLIKELSRARGAPGVKVIELVQIERRRSSTVPMTNATYPSEHIFSMGY